MRDIFQPEGTVQFDSLCQLCKQPLRLYVPDDSRGELTKEAIDTFVRFTVHDECARERARLERENRKAEVILARQEKWETMCPPEFLKDLDFSRPNCQERIFDQVMSWEFNPRGILIHGPSARCKTRFIFKLLEREHNAVRKVIALTHPEFRLQISALASENQTGLAKYMVNLCKVAEILFIDDLGKGNFTSASEEALSEIIDQRSRWHRPIFFSTNDDMRTLGKRLSADREAPMLRRIMDYCKIISA